MDDLEDFVMRRAPTADRPLLGLTVLVVEDSRYACEAVRLMCLRSGARIRRADCLRSAAKHLKVYRPSVVIIDLGLPDGSGADLIRELADCAPRVGVIIGISGDTNGEATAMQAGADGYLEKPIQSLAQFQECILRHLPREVQPKSPRQLPDDVLVPDQLALKDDLAHASDLLKSHTEGPVLKYVAQFVGGLAVSAGDTPLLSAAQALNKADGVSEGTRSAVGQLTALVNDRISGHRVV